ncbi:testis-expressed protein 26 isoform X2 [Kogia breviceps]|uniref:testis-expressed protein 26 isoform X2 n=1 Tax=Kogia breviceps TaxID=27615 RepID=UPI0034D26C60
MESTETFESRDKAWVSSMAVTTGVACAYVADQDSFVRVCNTEKYGLQGPEPQPPKGRCDVLAGPYQHGDIFGADRRRKGSAVILPGPYRAPAEQRRGVHHRQGLSYLASCSVPVQGLRGSLHQVVDSLRDLRAG